MFSYLYFGEKVNFIDEWQQIINLDIILLIIYGSQLSLVVQGNVNHQLRGEHLIVQLAISKSLLQSQNNVVMVKVEAKMHS
jgi:hypothetical protein